MSIADVTAQAVDDLKRKQDRRTRWSKIGGIFIALAFVVRAGAAIFGPAHIHDCDDSQIQTVVTDLLNEAADRSHSVVKVSALSAFKSQSRTDKLARCTAHVALTDKSQGTVGYDIDKNNVKITAVN